MQRYLFITLILIVISHLNAVSRDKGEVFYDRVRRDYLKLLKYNGFGDLKRVESVIRGFETVSDAYTDSKKAPHGLFMAGEVCLEVYKRNKDDRYLQRAIINYSKLTRKYPRNSLADDGQIRIADIYRVYRNDKERAIKEYQRVIERFPKGDQKKKAEFWLKKLKEEKQSIGNAVEVSKINIISGENYTRVSIELTGEAEFSHFLLPEDKDAEKPRRIAIDIKNANLSPYLKEPIPVQNEHLLQIRSSQFTNDTVRIVIDLKSIEEYNSFYFEDPFRIIVDVTGRDSVKSNIDSIIKEVEDVESLEEKVGAPLEEKSREEIAERTSERIHVFIDPGHGGEDPGAIGRSRRMMEKDVVLGVALELRELLEKNNYRVSMSRDRDLFIPLPERTAMANRAGADLFVSIHANASRRRGAQGIETYFFDLSSDQDVLKLAAMENGVSIDKLDTLQFILTDMERTPIRNLSAMLASSVQDSLYSNIKQNGIKSRNLGVKHGPFYVLKGARMPAILVEIAFITNPREERLLATKKFRRKIAEGIFNGIKTYLNNMKRNPVAFLP